MGSIKNDYNYSNEVSYALPVQPSSAADVRSTGSEPSVPMAVNKAAQRVFEAMKTIAFHSVLTLGKMIVLPILLSATTLLATATLISLLFSSRSGATVPKDNEDPLTPFQHFAALTSEFCEVILIGAKYGTAGKAEQLQKVNDNEPNGPEFVLIKPKNVSPNNAPILYAPGYLDEPDTLRDTCRRIAEEAGAPVYIVKYRSRFQDIKEHSADVKKLADRIFEDSKGNNPNSEGNKDLVLIGHSMGGLVTGDFIIENNKPGVALKRNIKEWITVSTPLKGTNMAYLGIGGCARDMRPGSPFLKNFNANIPGDVPSLHIYTKTDLVVPEKSAKGPDKERSFLTQEASGHLAVRTTRSVESKIIQTIKQSNQTLKDVPAPSPRVAPDREEV